MLATKGLGYTIWTRNPLRHHLGRSHPCRSWVCFREHACELLKIRCTPGIQYAGRLIALVYLDESSFITQFLPGPFLLHRLRACRTLAQVQTIAQRRVPCVPVTDMSLTVSPHLTPEGSMTALSSDTSPGSGTICSMACSNSQPQKSPSRTSRTRALQIRQSGEGEEGLGGRGEGGRAKETQKCRAIVLAPSLSTTS